VNHRLLSRSKHGKSRQQEYMTPPASHASSSSGSWGPGFEFREVESRFIPFDGLLLVCTRAQLKDRKQEGGKTQLAFILADDSNTSSSMENSNSSESRSANGASPQDRDVTVKRRKSTTVAAKPAKEVGVSEHGNSMSITNSQADTKVDMRSSKRTRSSASARTYQCEHCHTTDSPEWRRGPSGNKTLCNACGLRYARRQAKSSLQKKHQVHRWQQEAAVNTAQPQMAYLQQPQQQPGMPVQTMMAPPGGYQVVYGRPPANLPPPPPGYAYAGPPMVIPMGAPQGAIMAPPASGPSVTYVQTTMTATAPDGRVVVTQPAFMAMAQAQQQGTPQPPTMPAGPQQAVVARDNRQFSEPPVAVARPPWVEPSPPAQLPQWKPFFGPGAQMIPTQYPTVGSWSQPPTVYGSYLPYPSVIPAPAQSQWGVASSRSSGPQGYVEMVPTAMNGAGKGAAPVAYAYPPAGAAPVAAMPMTRPPMVGYPAGPAAYIQPQQPQNVVSVSSSQPSAPPVPKSAQQQ
jgi:hypothetical protein